MATFTDIYKQELKGKGILNSLGTAALKRTREKLDIRNMLFGGSGAIAATGQKVFGKGYQAIQKGGSTAKVVSQNIGTQSIAMDQLLISSQKQESQLAIIAKNTMNSNAMARDMNVMRQNIMKLVTMGGGKASRGADMFFKEAAAREASYESQFKKGMEKTPTAIGSASKDKDKKSFLSTLFSGALSGIGFAITTLGKTLISALSGIKDILTDVKNLITGIKLSDLFKIGATGGIAGIVTSILSVLKSPVVLTALAVILPSLYALMKAREGSKAGVPEDASRKQQLSSNQTAIMESKNVRISGVWADGKNTQKSAFDLIQEEQNLNQLVSKNPKMLDEKAKKLSAMRINALASEGFYPLGDYTPGKNKELLFRREVKEPNMLDLPDTKPEKVDYESRVGARESGGKYDTIFGKAGGAMINGKLITENTISEVVAWQESERAKKSNKQAAGKYQFMDVGSAAKAAGLKPDDLFNGPNQEKMMQAYTAANAKSLERLGLPSTTEYLSMAHAVGADGAKKLIDAQNAGEGSKNSLAILGLKGAAAQTNPQLNTSVDNTIAKLKGIGSSTGAALASASTATSDLNRASNTQPPPQVNVTQQTNNNVAGGKAPSAPVASATNVDALELFFKYAM
jgi:hypothetical protein